MNECSQLLIASLVVPQQQQWGNAIVTRLHNNTIAVRI